MRDDLRAEADAQQAGPRRASRGRAHKLEQALQPRVLRRVADVERGTRDDKRVKSGRTVRMRA